MKTLLQIDGLEGAAQLPARPLHLAIGMFDGVHRGHSAVVGAAVKSAQRDAGLAAVLTFWPHPGAVLRPGQTPRLIMDAEAKGKALAELGVEALITQPFTSEYACIEAESFVAHLKKFLPQLTAIYVGENWRFGRDRRGDVDLLKREASRFGVSVTSLSRHDEAGVPVSSTRVRALLQAGDVAAVQTLLGRPYVSSGIVQPGKQLGRTIGFPTLNVPWMPELQPKYGVYAVQVAGAKSHGKFLPAVANYGLRPTVETADEPRLEIHVLTECPFDTGDTLTIEWLRFVRAEMKFSGVEALKAQIAKDSVQVATDFSLR